MAPAAGRGYIPWPKSEARSIVLDDLQNGRLSLLEAEMPAQQAWERKYRHLPAFKYTSLEQFSARLSDHREQVIKQNQRVSLAVAAFERDRKIHPVRSRNDYGQVIFARTPAAALLDEDIKNGRNVGLTPAEFRMTRPEYQLFPPEQFRPRIYQAQRKKKWYNYLDQKRAENEAKVKKGWKKVEEELELKWGQEQEDP